MGKKLLFIVLISVLLLAACGKKDESPAPTPIPATPEVEEERITILFAVGDVERSLYEDLAKSFEETNPDIHVQLVSINETLGLDLVGGGDLPDDYRQRLIMNG